MPTLWLKAPNKHSITHIMYIEMEMLAIKMYIRKKERKLIRNADEGSHTCTHAHTKDVSMFDDL